MSLAADFLEKLQEDASHRLASDPYTGQVKVITQRKGDIQNDVISALSVLNESEESKIGACIVVLMPDLEVTSPNVAGPIGEVVLTARVMTAPVFNESENGTGLSCEKLALRALHILHHFNNKGIVGTLVAKGDALKPYTADQSNGIVGYDVSVRTMGGIASGDKVSTPVLSGHTSAVTITCGTDGAAIYYTTDGSYPGSGNPGATLYTGAFAVDSGTTVRAGAEEDNSVPSDPSSATFTGTVQYADLLIAMNDQTTGANVTGANLAAGTRGGSVVWSTTPDPVTGFTIEAGNRPPISTWIIGGSLTINAGQQYCKRFDVSEGFNYADAFPFSPGTRKATAFGWFTIRADGSFKLYDYLNIKDADGVNVVAQYRDDQKKIGIECTFNGTNHSALIDLTIPGTYFLSLNSNADTALATLYVYNSAGVLVGSTTIPQSTANIAEFRFGNGQEGKQAITSIEFVGLDWTNADNPKLP